VLKRPLKDYGYNLLLACTVLGEAQIPVTLT